MDRDINCHHTKFRIYHDMGQLEKLILYLLAACGKLKDFFSMFTEYKQDCFMSLYVGRVETPWKISFLTIKCC